MKRGKKPGSPKTGGRVKGTPNKTTASLKTLVHDFLNANVHDLQNQYNQLEATQKLLFFEKLLKYALPTQTQSSINFSELTDSELDFVIEKLKTNAN